MKDFPDLPPVWFAGCGALSWLLAKGLPVAVIELPDWLGWAIFGLGLLWAGTAAGLFLRNKTPVEPRTSPRFCWPRIIFASTGTRSIPA